MSLQCETDILMTINWNKTSIQVRKNPCLGGAAIFVRGSNTASLVTGFPQSSDNCVFTIDDWQPVSGTALDTILGPDTANNELPVRDCELMDPKVEEPKMWHRCGVFFTEC